MSQENVFETQSESSALDSLFDTLFPLTRSITGPGLRESLRIFQQVMPLELHGVPSGTEVFDWTVPEEWRIHDAYLKGPDGTVYADYEESNLQVVNYSQPIDTKLPLSELDSHLYTNPNVPDVVPYVTSYYDRTWGFCLPHDVYESLPEGEYHAYIDTEFIDWELTYGHTLLEGNSNKEVLLSSYLCHPSMANNELSGPLVLAALYNRLKSWDNREYTYRFVLAPETIGSLAYLNEHGDDLQDRLVSGAVLTCLGGPQDRLSYQFSRQGDALLDDTVRNLRDYSELAIETRPFTPTGGSDERQYCSPGFDLPVGQFARTIYGEYDVYHSSGDDKEFMTIDALVDSVDALEQVLASFERAGRFLTTKPYGEPMLSKYDLYPSVNSPQTWSDSTDKIVDDDQQLLDAVLRILNYSDGTNTIADIASEHEYSLPELLPVISILREKGLLRRCENGETV